MEILLLIGLAVNLAATCWYGRKLSKREEYRIEFMPLTSEFFETQEDIELEDAKDFTEQKEAPQPDTTQAEPSKGPKVSYTAWENRSNIPWVESNRPVATPVPLKKQEPLARPDGFV